MAFTSAVTERNVEGNKRVIRGTFTNTGGSTGGAIATTLNNIDFMNIEYSGASAPATAPAINATFPLASSSVTIVTEANTSGYWEAKGI